MLSYTITHHKGILSTLYFKKLKNLNRNYGLVLYNSLLNHVGSIIINCKKYWTFSKNGYIMVKMFLSLCYFNEKRYYL